MAKRAPRYKGIRDRLKTARKDKGLTLIALGTASGLTHATIQHIETGRTIPGIDTVEKIADALGVDPRWLAYGGADGPALANRTDGKSE